MLKSIKKSVNAVLLLIYIVHPSGSDIFETSNEKVKTCGMYGPLKNPVHSFIKKSFFFPLLNNLFSVFKQEKISIVVIVIYIQIF